MNLSRVINVVVCNFWFLELHSRILEILVWYDRFEFAQEVHCFFALKTMLANIKRIKLFSQLVNTVTKAYFYTYFNL